MAARYDRITQNRFSRLRTDLPDKTRNFQENTIQSGWLLQGIKVQMLRSNGSNFLTTTIVIYQ